MKKDNTDNEPVGSYFKYKNPHKIMFYNLL